MNLNFKSLYWCLKIRYEYECQKQEYKTQLFEPVWMHLDIVAKLHENEYEYKLMDNMKKNCWSNPHGIIYILFVILLFSKDELPARKICGI